MQSKKQKAILFLMTALLAGAVFGLNIGQVLAQEGTPQQPETPPTPTPVVLREVSDDEVNSVAGGLYCPVCSNVPLDQCGTKACADWREVIRTKLAEGWSADQINMYFAQRYGDQVLPVPPNPLIYIIPGVAILAAAVYVFGLLRPKKPATAVPAAQPIVELPADDPYLARLEAELAERKKK